MCGINGFNFKDEKLIRVMNSENAHRGPDRTSFWLGDTVSLGHNRLSIIDLSESANQPMTDSTGNYTIVFNGEIYNFKELRQELGNKYKFKSQSDTEVILYAYREYGEECVRKFNGIFSFAIWDDVRKEIFIARDRMGVKPLYYYSDGGKFIFSSEIKSILAHNIPRSVDPSAFNLYFHVLYVPEPHTMFSGIKKLAPAHYLRVSRSGLMIKKYWEVSDFSDLSSRDDAAINIKELFKDSVKRQLISDRSVGVFLSGGMDSTAILGAVSEESSGPVKTYSVGFDIAGESEKFNSDFLLAKATARHYGTDHHELVVSGKDVLDNLDKIVWHLDEPNFNPTAAAIFLLSQKAKEDVAVVLGGDGGDELFGGYSRYGLARMIDMYQRSLGGIAKSGIEKFLRFSNKGDWADKLTLDDGTAIFLSFMSQKQNLLSSVINPKFISERVAYDHFDNAYFKQFKAQGGDFVKHFMNIDRQSWLADESLMRTDKMTMAFGLEERVPILDYRLVELASRIPTAWKLNLGIGAERFVGKNIWKQAIKDYLPTHILSQKKRGWFTPMAKWIRGPLQPFVSDMISSLDPEFFNKPEMERVFADHLSGKRYNLNIIWSAVMWQLWHDRFIKNNNL